MPTIDHDVQIVSDRPTKELTWGSWRGHWIGLPFDVDLRPEPLHDTAGARPFSRVLFRRRISLRELPDSLKIRLTADSRYALFVNGVDVGRGPVRSQPRRLRFDEWDIAPLLHSGENTIVALVTYYGHANSFWMPAAANATLGRGPVFVFESADGEIISDESWEVQAASAWSDAVRAGHDGVPVEVLDARKLHPEWRAGHSFAPWVGAQRVPASHLGALARTQPPTDPYGPLLARPIGALGGGTVEPDSISVDSVRIAEDVIDHPVSVVKAALAQRASYTDDASANLRVGRHVAVDFGRIVAGFLDVEIDAPAGTIVDVMFRERAYDPTATEIISVPNTGARYVTRGDHDRFVAQEVNGFRFADFVLHGAEGEVELGIPLVREHLYRTVGNAFFRSSDEVLDSLYTAGRRTVELNSHDAFVDCPTREQRAWVGDGIVHQGVHLVTNADWRLAWWYLELAASPRPDGILPMSVVGEIEDGRGHTIPDYSLNWIHGVHTMYRYTGDIERILPLLPIIRNAIAWFLPYVDVSGVLTDLPEWNLVDWSSILLTGSTSIVTALWARALREYAEISAAAGNRGDSEWASSLYDTTRQGFEAFWDEDRGCYVDHIVDGQRRSPASQLAGAMAIESGLAPRERWDRIVDRIIDDSRVVTRSWIGGSGGYDSEKIVEQLKGVQRIDWDAREEVVRAEPFASFHVHDAVARAGRARELPRLLQSWSDEFLIDGYDTFGECWGWGTPVHGWSATPTRDIIVHLLGISPLEPGFEVARVAPAYGIADEFEGSAPTPFGPITVRVKGIQVEVDSPVPFELTDAAGRTSFHPAS